MAKESHKQNVRARHSLPRTAAAAKRAGFEKIEDLDLNELTEPEKENWLMFRPGPKSSQVPCGILPQPDGSYKICYIDPNTGKCNLCFKPRAVE